MKKREEIPIDPRDPLGWFWKWLLADSWQQPDIVDKHRKTAKRNTPEDWDRRHAGTAEDWREKREAWLADQELLLTFDPFTK